MKQIYPRNVEIWEDRNGDEAIYHLRANRGQWYRLIPVEYVVKLETGRANAQDEER